MKLQRSLLLCILIFSLFTPPVFAVSSPKPIILVGIDNDQNALANIKTRFNTSTFSYFTINQATAETKQAVNDTIPITDTVKFQETPTLQVTLLANSDKTITPLTYADLLLTDGIYEGTALILNNVTNYSLAETISAYRQSSQTIPDTRIQATFQEYELMNEVNTQISDPQKTAQIFFDLNKYLMENPDLNIVTNGIVDIAVTRQKVQLSKEITSKLYTWTHTVSQEGNQWDGFYRDITITKQDSNSIAVIYSPLESAAANVNKDMTGNKVGALAVFLVFIGIIMYFAYKNKKNNIS